MNSHKSRFIITTHKAVRAGTHHDIRFRKPDSKIWISFATKSEIPLVDSKKKILIVKTHDHSEEEALFLGKIDEGYGKGIIEEWDSGDCEIVKFSSRHMSVLFKGKKIKGIYHIISTGVSDRNFKSPKYFFFRGKEINNSSE